jgi:thiamine pyrophosphate-dependent acetolactate synthase large subunit-like protein
MPTRRIASARDAYSVRIMGPTHVENVAHLACRTALLRRGVAHITFPIDLQEREIRDERSRRNIPGHTSDVLTQSARLPHEGDLAQAADSSIKARRSSSLPAVERSTPAPNWNRPPRSWALRS